MHNLHHMWCKLFSLLLFKMDSFKITNTAAPSLTEEEMKSAPSELFSPFQFRRVNRKLIDPQYPNEPKFILFSFIKAPNATCDEDGFFGVAKIRGAFFTEQEAAERAEKLIRDVDSTNSIYTCGMGIPFPLVVKGYAKELTEIDLQKKTENAISENVRAKRLMEQKEMNEIRERQQVLMKDEGKIDSVVNPEEQYVEQRVKLAHLRYAINEHIAKLAECRILEEKVKINLKERMKTNPEFEANYMDRYKRGRREVGISEDTDVSGFMKYMADPIDSPDISYIS